MAHRSGVLGRDISYSLSPKIHKLFAEEAGIDLNYEIYDVEDNPIPFIYNFFKEGGVGLNITKPYKEIVAQELESSEFAEDTSGINWNLVGRIDYKGLGQQAKVYVKGLFKGKNKAEVTLADLKKSFKKI